MKTTIKMQDERGAIGGYAYSAEEGEEDEEEIESGREGKPGGR